MNFENLKYDIAKNKHKIMLVGAILFFILTAIIVFKVFGTKFKYDSGFGGSVSNKYILATNILGANENGNISLYDTKTGEVLAKEKLNGDSFLYSYSSDMKSLNAYNTKTKELYSIKAKKEKINKSKIGTIDLGGNNITSFKYENDYFVGLSKDGANLICVNKKGPSVVVNLNLNASINDYAITDKNVVFTSGDYICTAKLTDGKGSKINIGALSYSIHKTKNKLFVHNSFGSDRNKSIVLDINPETLYINKAYQFKDSRVNMLQTSSESDLLYYSEEFLTSKEGNVKQVIKSIGEDLKNPAAIMKHQGNSSINKLNSYGYLGYMYYKNEETLDIFNLRSLEKEYTLNVHDDFYMPLY